MRLWDLDVPGDPPRELGRGHSQVTVRNRSREPPWGVGLTTPVIRTVHISAFCPNCGARRGERSWLTTFDDGERYWTETWSCSAGCGHVDHYANVVAEAERIAATHSDQSPPVGLVDVVAGPHTIVALGEDCWCVRKGWSRARFTCSAAPRPAAG